MKEWVNWSGSLRFQPSEYVEPKSELKLQEVIRQQFERGERFKIAAAGHSSSPLVRTNDVLINLGELKGLKQLDKGSATLFSGTTVHEANVLLQQHNLALFNTGDVDVQTLAGAISTGTHGSGRKLQNLAAVLKGVKMIDFKGDIHTFDDDGHPDTMNAMRVSLGALGIFSEITVRTVPLFQLRRVELFTDTNTCLDRFDALADENRNFDFYWYPRSDETKIRILNEPGRGSNHFNFPFYAKEEVEGNVGEILPKKRTLKFEEMEYALDRTAGLECFREVRKRVLERHRKSVAWRILVRSIARDDFFLSPHHGRESISISLHHNAGLPFDEYFSDIEPIFIAFGGRPHWAKKHNMKAIALRKLYPQWDTFHSLRRQFDPNGFFMNDHLKEIFEQ